METALEKTIFRNSLLTRRCVIPSTGFYKWQKVGGQKKKDKHLLAEPDKGILYMAGMIGTFYHADGEQYDAFTILTTSTNESVSPLHD